MTAISFVVPGPPKGKGRPRSRVPLADLIAAYKELKSVQKVGAKFGLCGASVHERLQRSGVSKPPNFFSEDERERLRIAYGTAAESGALGGLAAAMGRTKPFICRQARVLGLTNQRRPKPYLAEIVSAHMKDWFAANPHPRGMHGKRHNAEAKNAMAASHSARYAALTPHQRELLTANAGSARWKAGWREFGGKRHYYRSRWEANYGRYLQWLKGRGLILEWEHEPQVFWFDKIKRGVTNYLPDFRVTELDGSVSYHEVKGWMDARSKTKIKRMRIYYKNVKLIIIPRPAYKRLEQQVRALVPEWEQS